MSDILEFVRSELECRNGEIRTIAAESGIAYDTCLRIKNGEGDPGYSKVRQLAAYLKRAKESPNPSPRPASGPGAKSGSDPVAMLSGAPRSAACDPAGGLPMACREPAQGVA